MWSARCHESGTPGAGRGPKKRLARKTRPRFGPTSPPAVLPHLHDWCGRPLTSHDVIVNSIQATTTHTGLKVHAELDPGTYDTGIKVSDTDIDALPMHRHRFHGDWNYTLHPQHRDTAGATEGPRPAEGPPSQSRAGWSPQPGTDRHDRAGAGRTGRPTVPETR